MLWWISENSIFILFLSPWTPRLLICRGCSLISLLLQTSANSHLSGREQSILVSQVFTTIGLSEGCHTGWVQSSGLRSTSCGNTESKRSIVHAVNDYTLVLWAVLRPTSNVCLDNVAAVKERHLSVGLNPDLVASVLRKDWKCGNVKTEFSCLGELAYYKCQPLRRVPLIEYTYPSRYQETKVYLSRWTSQDSQGKVARSSISAGEDGRRIDQSLGYYRSGQWGSWENFQCSLQALQTKSEFLLR